MCGVVIAANEQWFALFVELVKIVEGGSIEVEFVFEADFGGFAVWEVDVEENEVVEFGGLDAALVVEASVVEAGGYFERFAFGVNCRAGVAFFDGGMEVTEIAFGALDLGAELVFVGFDFLEREDVGAFVIEPVEEAFFLDGAQAINIPRDDFHVWIK